jgi:hypothetical protein
MYKSCIQMLLSLAYASLIQSVSIIVSFLRPNHYTCYTTAKLVGLFGAQGESQIHGLRAAVDLLGAGSAVASSIVGSAVEDFAASTRAQSVLVTSKGVAPLGAELVVGVVGVLGEGVAEEEGLVESLGLGDLDGRSRGAEVLRERLSGLDGGKSAGAAAVGVGLDVDSGAAAVDDNSLLSRGKAQEGGNGEDGDLHFERGEK